MCRFDKLLVSEASRFHKRIRTKVNLKKMLNNKTLQLAEALTQHLDPVAKYKALEYAANHIMLLPTSKIKELTGVKPSKNRFQRGTFIFSKTEKKIGRETAWQVQMTPSAYRPGQTHF